MKKLISILSPTYNEEDNVDELYKQINAVTLKLKKYEFEHQNELLAKDVWKNEKSRFFIDFQEAAQLRNRSETISESIISFRIRKNYQRIHLS